MTTLTDLQVQERTRDRRRSELAEMPLSTNAGALMIPIDGRDLMDKANTMAQSGLMVKDIFRGQPGACAGLILLCAPYRINPFQASWKCYQVKADAPLAFEAQFIMAMINTAAPITGRLKFAYEGEGPTRCCIVTATDRDSGEVLEYRSPMKKDIGVQNSPLWKNDPDQQLSYFSARSFARRHYPEILLGVYDRDEIETAAPIRDVTPARRAQVAEQSSAILAALPEIDEGEPLIVETLKAQPEDAVIIDGDLFGGPTPEQLAAAEAEAMAAIQVQQQEAEQA